MVLELRDTVVCCGKDSQLTGADREHAEVSMLALHLLQSAMVHTNTLLLQAVLVDPQFHDPVGDNERRALSPLFWSNINPYGRFPLDMDTRLDLTRERVTGLCPCRWSRHQLPHLARTMGKRGRGGGDSYIPVTTAAHVRSELSSGDNARGEFR
ncbi:Tn3 family transposase [Nocardia sp. NPDC059091]|uniref:Tn3 family transposase n=1 Tax=Nocardia sp. NPDC059091 TaxID=3346724 RepID=UPI0036A3B1EF